MKHLTHRALALLLALALCISMLPGMAIAATVDYVTGSVQGDKENEVFADVIKNWGVRGETATFLSPNAVAFYEKNGVTYDDLAAKPGSAEIATVADSELYKALQALMASNHKITTSYNDTRNMYSYTDCQSSDEATLTCFYSGAAIGPEWDSGSTWNREHTWPKSKCANGESSDEANDIMMLRPAAGKINSSRGDKAYGEGVDTKFYDPNAVSGGAYSIRGDVARIMLYTYVRWGDTENMWDEDGVIESKEILLKWMTEDPVDTWEMGRNDSVESITGTRNVFVDYPELAYTLLGEAVPTDLTSPSGEGYVSAYTITAVSGNPEQGTVEVNGNKIVAFPVEGYEVVGATVTAGTAAVTQNGNVFTVDASSDCTVQISFRAKADITVTYYENGEVTMTNAVKNGDTVTLPAAQKTVDEYNFLGWVTYQLTQTTEAPDFYAEGDKLAVTGNVTLYALYSRVDESASGSSSSFDLYSGEITEGDYLITYGDGAMKAAVVSSRLAYTDITPTNGTVLNASDDIIWTIAFTSDGYVTLYNASTGKYAAGTGAKNNAGLITSVTDYGKWTASGNSTYEFVNLGNENKGVNKTLRRNGTYGFATYSTSTGGTLTLYKRAGGAVYYSTGTQACEHINTTDVEAKAPTCTEAGYTAGVYCEDCKSYIAGYEKVEAAGHSYDAVVTEPTWDDYGYTTYTCSACGDSYVGDTTDALKWIHTISFSVPAGVEAVADITSTYYGFTMPTAGDVEGYTFEGWTTGAVEDTTEAVTILKAGSTHARTTEPLRFYAVYSYVVGGSEVSYKLVENVDQLVIGKPVIIAAQGYDYAISTNQKSNNRGAAAITKDSASKTITFGSDVAVLTLGEGTVDGTYSFYDPANSGYLYAPSNNNYLRTEKTLDTDGKGSFKITIAGGVTSVVAASSSVRGTLQFNNGTASNLLFSCYSSASQKAVCLYIETGEAGTTHYTTLTPPAGCEHEYVDGLCCKCEIVGDGEQNYASLADAIENTAADYLYLNFNLTEDVTVDCDVILDLKGKTLTGDIEILNGASLKLFDSATADYTAENRGKVVGQITGNLVRTMNTPEGFGHNYKYLAIQETNGSWSAHRIYLTVKSVALAPCIRENGATVSAISYKTVFKCSDFVADYVSDYGVQLTGEDTVSKSYGIEVAGGENWGSVRLESTLSTANTDEVNAANAAAKVAVSARITLADGTEVVSAAVTRSLQDLVVYANGAENLTDVQKKALGKMYTAFAGVMESWDIENIKSYAK